MMIRSAHRRVEKTRIKKEGKQILYHKEKSVKDSNEGM